MKKVGRQQDEAVDVLRQGRSMLKNGHLPLTEEESIALDLEISSVNEKLQQLRDHITQRYSYY